MTKRAGCTAIALATTTLVSSADALEKVVRFDTEESGWTSGSTCLIIYYNRCTLWSWAWSGFGDGGRLGVCADNCCVPDAGLVTATQMRVFTGAPTGYGFTGSIALTNVDANCCPTTTLASQPHLPTGPFDVHFWAQAVPLKFALVLTMASATNPAMIGTDHPAAGPTGPQACGFCYPLNRANHSFAWGTAATPVCPGSTFNDGVCDAQLRWDIFGLCPTTVGPESWSRIKAIYR